MICIYDSKTTDFNNNGLVVLDSCKSCFIEEKLNGQYELTLEYPLDDRGKWQYLVDDNVIKADGQLFRIYHKSKKLTGIFVNARHIFYDLLDNFLEDVRPTNLSGAGALNWILTHTQYPHNFISVSDVGGSNTKYFVHKNPVEAVMGDDGIIANWGGELVRDNFTIKLLQARGADRGVLISYGKNIEGIEETLDEDSVCTRLYPTGKDGITITGGYIDSQYIGNYAHPKIRTVEFQDCADEASLIAAGNGYLRANEKPPANYNAKFIELTKTEEYKNYSQLETVYLGDTVIVRHTRLGMDLKAKVIRTKKNILTGRLEEVELGSFKQDIGDNFTELGKGIIEARKVIVQSKSDLQTAIDNATAQIASALGGYVVKRNGEILIMDTEDVNTATKVWRWNEKGLGYSGTGYNGQFRTAITADGHIVADFMDTGNLTASLIHGGTMSLTEALTIVDSSLASYKCSTIFNSGGVTLKRHNTANNADTSISMSIDSLGNLILGVAGLLVGSDGKGELHCGSLYAGSVGCSSISSGVYNGIGRKSGCYWYGTLQGDGSETTVVHNLGYNPMVSMGGNLGNVNPTYKYVDYNTLKVCNWNSNNNPWTGTVYMW